MQEAVTEYTVVAFTRAPPGELSGGLSTVYFTPLTGRTHQLRRHAAKALGRPILGDARYGVLLGGGRGTHGAKSGGDGSAGGEEFANGGGSGDGCDGEVVGPIGGTNGHAGRGGSSGTDCGKGGGLFLAAVELELPGLAPDAPPLRIVAEEPLKFEAQRRAAAEALARA
eukprot:NODE_8600_length_1483_cov_2.987463.p1 GENE.NODE_8600_length_1483_cov_2.987463~~NODE_8600_length_1483_cov_2.987463.p1  ORF type:complete len:169 (+),score=48.23 NODE_8600_length_1483_cov_2.987463:891-1397(+)